jgi:hypothetical protein
VPSSPASPARPVLTASVTDEAHAGWQAFAADHDVTVAALVEAVGLALGAPDGLPKRFTAEIIAVAEQVAVERRRRAPDPK